MKKKELKTKNDNELKALLTSHAQRIAEIRFTASHARSKNVKETRQLRRMSARIKTLLRERSQ